MIVKNRELRKEARKEAASGKKRALRKDPGIPNLWPFKEKLLNKVNIFLLLNLQVNIFL